jgi:hypothetical protein
VAQRDSPRDDEESEPESEGSDACTIEEPDAVPELVTQLRESSFGAHFIPTLGVFTADQFLLKKRDRDPGRHDDSWFGPRSGVGQASMLSLSGKMTLGLMVQSNLSKLGLRVLLSANRGLAHRTVDRTVGAKAAPLLGPLLLRELPSGGCRPHPFSPL